MLIKGSVSVTSMPTVDITNTDLTTIAGTIDEGAQVGIDFAHHEVHEGCHFIVSDYDSDVDTAAPKYWRFVAPNTATRCHFIFTVSCGPSGGIWTFYEAPTVTVNGTGITPRNNDRNSANVAELVASYDPTVTANGTLLWTTILGSSGGSSRVGGESQSRIEVILDQGTTYVLKFAQTSNDTSAAIIAKWYEQ